MGGGEQWEERYRAMKFDDSSPRRTRRFFGADFMLVLIVLIGALYFVWPLMFEPKRAYIEESAVAEAFAMLGHARDRLAAAGPDLDAQRAAGILRESPALQAGGDPNRVRILLVDAGGAALGVNGDPPDFWGEILPTLLGGGRGALSRPAGEGAWLILYEKPAGMDFTLAAAKPFPPPFKPSAP